MRHALAGAGLMLGAFLAIAGSARSDDAPAVLGPVVDPSEPQPLPIRPAPAESTKVPENRPILVMPGINTPRPARPVRESTVAPSPATSTPRPEPASRARNSPPQIRLETIPDEPAPRESLPRNERPVEPMPRRAPGLLGRMIPPITPYRGGSGRRDGVTVEPRTDPAADAAIKRRVERQILENLGGRIRFAEVRVVGRQVVIRARPARFWQKRSVRSELEALPGLNGYKVDIQLVD